MIEKDLRRYLLTINPIREIVKDNIYAGRIPETAKPIYAILLRRISGTRTYYLGGEEPFTQPIIQVDMLSRNAVAEIKLDELSENVRLALNKYAAAPGKIGETFVHCINIISENVDIPQPPIASGIAWKRQRSFDIQITHEQQTTFA